MTLLPPSAASLAFALGWVACLSACGSTAAPPLPADCRLLARPADPHQPLSVLAEQAGALAGLTVQAAPAAPDGWVLLTLQGASAADCRRATMQLVSAKPPLFEELHRDERRQTPRRPQGPTTL